MLENITVTSLLGRIKTHTHMLILAGSELELAVESADSTTESAGCSTDSVIVGRLFVLNMFNILNPLELADGSWLTLGVG